jgi:hypothetical protein
MLLLFVVRVVQIEGGCLYTAWLPLLLPDEVFSEAMALSPEFNVSKN